MFLVLEKGRLPVLLSFALFLASSFFLGSLPW